MLPCSFAYECVPTREAVGVKVQPSEGLADVAERLRNRAIELVITKVKVLQAGEVRADAVRDGTWLIREGVVGSTESWCNVVQCPHMIDTHVLWC